MRTQVYKEHSEQSSYNSVEHRIMGYLVRGRVPKRKELNPMGQFYAANHDCRAFWNYLVERGGRCNERGN